MVTHTILVQEKKIQSIHYFSESIKDNYLKYIHGLSVFNQCFLFTKLSKLLTACIIPM